MTVPFFIALGVLLFLVLLFAFSLYSKTYARFLKIPYSIFFAAGTAVLILSFWNVPERIIQNGSEVKWQWADGNFGRLTGTRYAISLFDVPKADYLPEDLLESLETWQSREELMIGLKVVWIIIILGQWIAMFLGSQHARNFLPLVALITTWYLAILAGAILTPVEPFNQMNIFVPTAKQSPSIAGEKMLVSYYALFFSIVHFVTWFSPKIRKGFGNYAIEPMLLPLEKRNEHLAALTAASGKNNRLIQAATQVLFVVALILISLLVGNLLYFPLFSLQLSYPAATFFILFTFFGLLQLFYMRGYATTFREFVRRESVAELHPAVRYLFSFSYLTYKAFRNVLMNIGYIVGIIFLITMLLMILYQNVRVYEDYNLIPRKTAL